VNLYEFVVEAMELSSLYQSASAAIGSLPVAYKLLCAVLVVFALNKAFHGAERKGYNKKNLPRYAPIELAIASYILSGNGLGRRILYYAFSSVQY
jgi:hypothetical protein